MRKLHLVLVALTALSGSALAAASPLYLGGQFSATNLKETDDFGRVTFDFNTLTVLAGYQFTDHVAAEVRFGRGVKDESFSEPGFSERLKVKQQTMLLLKGAVPLSDSFSLYGLAGYGGSKFEYQVRNGNQSFRDQETLDGFAWGVGAGLTIAPRLTLTLEYLQLPQEKFRDGNDNYKLQANNLSFGLNYQF